MFQSFGQFIKKKRIKLGITLRDFCISNGLDPVEYSKLERDRIKIPCTERLSLALALRIDPNSRHWARFFRIAAHTSNKRETHTDYEALLHVPLILKQGFSTEDLKGLLDMIKKA